MALLALIAGQDMEPDEGSDGTDGRWRITRGVAPDRVASAVDPEARHAHKTVHRRQDGFKAHLAVEPDTGSVTGCALTKAARAQAAHPHRARHPLCGAIRTAEWVRVELATNLRHRPDLDG